MGVFVAMVDDGMGIGGNRYGIATLIMAWGMELGLCARASKRGHNTKLLSNFWYLSEE